MHPPAGPTARRAITVLSASLLVLAIPWAASAQDQTQPPTTEAEPPAATAAVDAAAAPALTTPGRLRQAEHPKGGLGQRIFDIIEGGPGYIAVGGGTPDGLDHRALVWLSDDGSRWLAQPLFGEATVGTMRAVAALPDGGYVAVGHDFEPQTVRDELVHALVWYSADGYGWQRVPADASFPGSMMWDVTSTPDGVAVAGCVAGFHCDVGRVWTSTDGFEWQLTDDIAMAPYDIAADTEGHLVIGGETNAYDLVGSQAAAAASTEDWTVRTFATGGSLIAGATPYEGGFLLTGTLWPSEPDAVPTSALQVTEDGVDWAVFEPAPLDGVYALDIDAAGELAVLIGQGRGKKGQLRPAILWSHDLETFKPVKTAKGFDRDAFGGEDVRLTDDGSRLFVMGTDANRPAIWSTTFE